MYPDPDFIAREPHEGAVFRLLRTKLGLTEEELAPPEDVRGHAELDVDPEVDLALGRLGVPHHLLRQLLAALADILAEHAVLGAQQMLEEVFMALAA